MTSALQVYALFYPYSMPIAIYLFYVVLKCSYICVVNLMAGGRRHPF